MVQSDNADYIKPLSKGFYHDTLLSCD